MSELDEGFLILVHFVLDVLNRSSAVWHEFVWLADMATKAHVLKPKKIRTIVQVHNLYVYHCSVGRGQLWWSGARCQTEL